MGQASVSAGSDGSFTFSGLTPGKYTLRATLPPGGSPSGWITKAVSAGGHDATDVPVQVSAGENLSDALIVFGDRPSEISGTLTDADGRAAGDYFVVLLPADPARWRSTNRRVTPARVSTDGQFTFRNLLAGDYLLAVVKDLEPATINDPEILTELARNAVKVAIAEGEKKAQPLKIGKAPE